MPWTTHATSAQGFSSCPRARMNGVLTHVAVTNSTTQSSHLGLATPRPAHHQLPGPASRAVNKLSSGAWNEMQASVNVGKATGDLHSLQQPDLPIPSLPENITCVSFSWRLLTWRFSTCVQAGSDQASTESPADDEQLLSSCEQDSRLDAFALTSSASASEP